MELYQLRSFVAVARENHLPRAAERLNISQPAVSAHIKALEQEFDLVLFERTPTGMRLTEAGRKLVQEAKQVLQQVQGVSQRAAELRDSPGGVVRIGLNRSADFLRITPLYKQLHRNWPGIEVVLHQAVSATVLKMVVSGELDCGFMLGPCRHPDLHALELAVYRLRVVGPASFAQRLDASDLTGLADFPWIGIPEDGPYARIMEKYFYSRGIRLKTGVIADQQSAILSMVQSGAGLSFMLEEEAFSAQERERIAIWPGGSFPIGLFFISRKSDSEVGAVQAVVREIRTIWPDETDPAGAGIEVL
jgi:DNA-binding transcriptional LysR family regulator